jgi:hypothetical protein
MLWKTKPYRISYWMVPGVNEWVVVVYLTTNEQFVSYIMAGISHMQRNYNDVRFVLGLFELL